MSADLDEKDDVEPEQKEEKTTVQKTAIQEERGGIYL